MRKVDAQKKALTFSGKILWKSFNEIKKLEEENKKISRLKKELEILFKEKNYKMLSLKILDFLREILTTSGKKYPKKKELWDDLYWLRYSFVDEDENSFLLDKVSAIFFEFQSDIEYDKLIKRMDSIRKELS